MVRVDPFWPLRWCRHIDDPGRPCLLRRAASGKLATCETCTFRQRTSTLPRGVQASVVEAAPLFLLRLALHNTCISSWRRAAAVLSVKPHSLRRALLRSAAAPTRRCVTCEWLALPRLGRGLAANQTCTFGCPSCSSASSNQPDRAVRVLPSPFAPPLSPRYMESRLRDLDPDLLMVALRL
jgi:hypothetical protein